MDQLTLWIYKQHDLPEGLDANAALLVLSERLNTANNVIKSLDREKSRLETEKDRLETEKDRLEEFKAEQESARARRRILFADLL